MSNKYYPIVSIIIPVYNGANFISQAIESALAQTYKNIEILIINDGSSDNEETEKIVLSYGDKVRYFSKENGGVSTALNLGIDKMQGEWFSWLSHDDLYTENKIEKQISLVKNLSEDIRNKSVVLSSGKLIDKDNNFIFHPTKSINKTLTSKEMFKRFSKGVGFNGCGFLIPKIIIDECGYFDENLRYIQDLDYWLRFIYNDYLFICHKDKLVYTRVHPNQTTVSKSECFNIERTQRGFRLVDKLFNNFDERCRQLLIINYCSVLKSRNKAVCDHIENGLKSRNAYTFIHEIYRFYYTMKGELLFFIKKLYRKIFLNKKRYN